MSAADILGGVLRINIAAAVAILAVIALRKMVRPCCGARLAYGLWLLPVLAGAAVMVPARQIFIVQSNAPTLAMGPGVRASMQASSTAAALGPDPAVLLVGLWLAGAAGAALIMVHLQQRFMRRAREGAVGPAVVGVIRPRIVMPWNFGDYSPAEQSLVLAHEQAHIARQDSRLNGLCAAAQCLCWFNPLVHLAARLMRIDQELACDEAVVTRFPGARRAYAEVLMKAQLAILPLPLGCYWPSKAGHPLVERVALLKRKDINRTRRSAGAAALAVLCAGVGLTAWAAQPADVRVILPKLARISVPPTPTPEVRAAAPKPEEAVGDSLGSLPREAPAPNTPEPEPSPPVERLTPSALSLEPVTGVEVSSPSLIPVRNQSPDEQQPLGPGHYVERSGLKSSGGCGSETYASDYRIGTRPVAPGRTITNFRYELVGDGRCKPRRPFDTVTATCEIVADRPDRKIVQFQLMPDGDYCFSFSAFQHDGSHHDTESGGTITQQGAVTRAEMVLSYDVQ